MVARRSICGCSVRFDGGTPFDLSVFDFVRVQPSRHNHDFEVKKDFPPRYEKNKFSTPSRCSYFSEFSQTYRQKNDVTIFSSPSSRTGEHPSIIIFRTRLAAQPLTCPLFEKSTMLLRTSPIRGMSSIRAQRGVCPVATWRTDHFV